MIPDFFASTPARVRRAIFFLSVFSALFYSTDAHLELRSFKALGQELIVSKPFTVSNGHFGLIFIIYLLFLAVRLSLTFRAEMIKSTDDEKAVSDYLDLTNEISKTAKEIRQIGTALSEISTRSESQLDELSESIKKCDAQISDFLEADIGRKLDALSAKFSADFDLAHADEYLENAKKVFKKTIAYHRSLASWANEKHINGLDIPRFDHIDDLRGMLGNVSLPDERTAFHEQRENAFGKLKYLSKDFNERNGKHRYRSHPNEPEALDYAEHYQNNMFKIKGIGAEIEQHNRIGDLLKLSNHAQKTIRARKRLRTDAGLVNIAAGLMLVLGIIFSILMSLDTIKDYILRIGS